VKHSYSYCLMTENSVTVSLQHFHAVSFALHTNATGFRLYDDSWYLTKIAELFENGFLRHTVQNTAQWTHTRTAVHIKQRIVDSYLAAMCIKHRKVNSYLDSSVCGSWILSMIVLFLFQRDSTGFAAARMDVRALSEQMIPAFAIDNVCCSCVYTTECQRCENPSIPYEITQLRGPLNIIAPSFVYIKIIIQNLLSPLCAVWGAKML